MTLCGNVVDRVGLAVREDLVESLTVTDVEALEAVAGITSDRVEPPQIGRIGQLVDIY